MQLSGEDGEILGLGDVAKDLNSTDPAILEDNVAYGAESVSRPPPVSPSLGSHTWYVRVLVYSGGG